VRLRRKVTVAFFDTVAYQRLAGQLGTLDDNAVSDIEHSADWKRIYDLWGDTVNTASRMESHGVPGRVHVSEATYQLLAEDFDVEKRAPIEVKGKAPMQTYLVVGQRRDPCRASVAVLAG
jgi:class 3 adenylate cyclase